MHVVSACDCNARGHEIVRRFCISCAVLYQPRCSVSAAPVSVFLLRFASTSACPMLRLQWSNFQRGAQLGVSV